MGDPQVGVGARGEVVLDVRGPIRRGRQRFGKTRGRSRSRLGGHYRLRPVVRVDRPERAEGLVERFVVLVDVVKVFARSSGAFSVPAAVFIFLEL